MGNSKSNQKSLFVLCKELYEFAEKKENSNDLNTIDEYNENIIEKINEYKQKNKIYKNKEALEYQTLISYQTNTNIFYKRDEFGFTEVEYAFDLYIRSKISHNIKIISNLIYCFPTNESKTIGKFCYDNKLSYQKLIKTNDISHVKFNDTKIYKLYHLLNYMSKQNNFNISLSFLENESIIEVTIENQSNNKKIKYVEKIIPYVSDNFFIFENKIYKSLDLHQITLLLK